MVALWGHRVIRPYHRGWVLGSPVKGARHVCLVFYPEKRQILGQGMGTYKVGLKLAKEVFP